MQPNKPLTAAQRADLESFLSHPDRPENTLTYRQLLGFFFTLASAPEMVPPSEWLPMVLGPHEPSFQDQDEAERILGAMMELYNEVNQGVLDAEVQLPADCAFRADLLANFEPEAPVREWCEGFRMGHLWLEESWDDLLPESMEDEFSASVLTLVLYPAFSRTSAVRSSGLPDFQASCSCRMIARCFDPENA